ncbi:DUF342 domain-containing protein [Simkania negevensis]|uniref:DUF342 domain-containing protein n=1 Tax=Simkania negevensis TaxID=83561 RepID=A0ABS3ASD8_9BACT|nr:DUF342 domain-containing protein [Simkania negevensis]
MGQKKKLTIEGENVHEAIQRGLTKIGLSQDDTIVKILQREYKGWLRNKPAVVELFFDKEESDNALRQLEIDKLAAGMSIVFEEESAKIAISNKFYDKKILKNEEERTTFLVKILGKLGVSDPEEAMVKLIAEDNQAQKALITVKQFDTIPLTDQGASIYLEISEDRMVCQALFFQSDTATYDDVLRVLKGNKVVKGIKRKAIETALKAEKSLLSVVAQGRPAIDDRSSAIEKFFAADEFTAFASMMEHLTVDTRAVKNINIAERNQLLLTIGDIIPGEDGYRTDGTVVERKLVQEGAVIKLGKNVYLSDNGKEIYAKAAGHISWMEELAFIDIEPVYIVDGNVDFSEGNVNFVGKVIIRGDVRPKFVVHSEGDIEIQGSIEDAVVESTTGNILVGGSIIHSNEGYVQAKGVVHAAIAMNANIRAKSIFIEKEAINSRLIAEVEINVTGSPGVFVGGEAKVKHIMRVNVAGSDSWVLTKIHVGDVSAIVKRLHHLQQRNKQNNRQMEASIKILNLLQYREKSASLSEAQKKQQRKVQSVIEDLQSELEFDTGEEREVVAKVQECQGARFEVYKTLYPHVDIYIYKGYLQPVAEENAIGFLCKEQLITRYPLTGKAFAKRRR